MQRETKKTVQPSVLVLKGKTYRLKAKALRQYPPVSYERAKQSSKKNARKGRENVMSISSP